MMKIVGKMNFKLLFGLTIGLWLSAWINLVHPFASFWISYPFAVLTILVMAEHMAKCREAAKGSRSVETKATEKAAE